MSSVVRSVAVIGAGAIGLATAALAQRAGFRVTIYTERPPEETTSAKAAASFKPAGLRYDERNVRMITTSLEEFGRIAAEFPDAGVRRHVHWEAFSTFPNTPWYLDFVENPELLEGGHVPGGYDFGWRYTTWFIDMPIFIAWLTGRFHESGGRLVVGRSFSTLEAIAALPEDLLFNCTGIGSRRLCRDESLVPVRGQIVLIGPQPEMDWSINHEGFYVYPRQHDTVLGGTREVGVWDESVQASVVDSILEANRRILPHLTLADVRATCAGLRPYRDDGVRIEVEEVNDRPIVHNYGHAGAGITMCWGSAQEALGLVT